MNLSPIVLFVYNRPAHTRETLEALAANDLANQSILYIYVDGPKHGAPKEDVDRIREVRNIIRSKEWCKEVNIIESVHNKGLADSIVGAVTEVVNRHGRVIVLEDDIVTTKGFLKYMNEALELYANEEKVMHISACMYNSDFDTKEDTFFLRVMSCQGWGTWKRAWAHYDNDVISHLVYLNSDSKRCLEFDIDGSAYFFEQLRRNVSGELKSWAVRWYASWWRTGGYSLFPRKSLVRNIGFDGSGVNSGTNKSYIGPTVDYLNVVKVPIAESGEIRDRVGAFWKRYLGQGEKYKVPLSKKLLSYASAPLFKLGRKLVRRLFIKLFPEMTPLFTAQDKIAWHNVVSDSSTCQTGSNVKLSNPYHIRCSVIGDYSYISHNSFISYTEIGKFCSIGPNFHCGWGIHPVDGLSTSPSFYSTNPANGISFCKSNKVQERKKITIGNDVFIGMNVTVLDGVTIGDGAVIGAGCVVSKDVPPYAIVVGNPMKILRYRFPDETIDKLRGIAWWNWPHDQLKDVEKYFFDVEGFIAKHRSNPDKKP